MRALRLTRILHTIGRYGLDEFLPRRGTRILRLPFSIAYFWVDRSRPRAERLRLALESLGPIFVKFGQLLSVRPDLIPEDVAEELSKLQDNVPPFALEQVMATLGRAYGRAHTEVFKSFSNVPIASASVAQVHFAELPDGREVAVKILRPGIREVIAQDVGLLHALAGLVEDFLPQGKRLRPREVVVEFEHTITDELDLLREAANASQLRRNFADGRLLVVPEVYWDWCNREVMVMQRIDGIPVNATARLREAGIDIPRLARDGVEIFFTQVFRDGFFHADMHPGNILVSPEGQYIALDFGIMGTLTETDQNYLAQNFIAFFRRDYRRVAEAHIESGWAPKDTPIDEFEAAIRTVCEPIFNKPLKEISFGRVLLRLFQTSRRFNIEVQPQLVMLQKTLLNIEGLGRDLDPDLDLWDTAKPYLERWMSERVGWRGLIRHLRKEVPYWTTMLPQIPRLIHRYLDNDPGRQAQERIDAMMQEQRRQTHLLLAIAGLLSAMLLLLLLG